MKTTTLNTIKKLLQWAIYATIIASIGTILTVWDYREQEQASFAASKPVPPAPMAVTIATVEEGSVSRWILGEGYAEAIRKAHLQFEEAGKIVFIANDTQNERLREGSLVNGPAKEHHTRGQVLARIDARDKYSDIRQGKAALAEAKKDIDVQQAALTQAKVDMAEAKRDLDRKKSLFVKYYLARSDYDQAQNKYKSAMAAVRMAQDRVSSARSRVDSAAAKLKQTVRGPEKTTLYAPFNGIVARINIKEDDYFDPSNVSHESKSRLLQTAPITLLDPTRMEITLSLPAAQGELVRTGQHVIVTPATESWPSDTTLQTTAQVTGSVYSVSPQIDMAKRAIRVKVRLTQQETIIPDGLYVSCWIAVQQKQHAVRIPLASLLYRGSIPYVYVEKNGTVSRKNLTLGIKDSAYAEVTNGLIPGERVVCKGRKKLTQGAAVRVVSNKLAADIPQSATKEDSNAQ